MGTVERESQRRNNLSGYSTLREGERNQEISERGAAHKKEQIVPPADNPG
jgi:hypothetical protein